MGAGETPTRSTPPRCPQCRNANLTLVELHTGAGCWSSNEWRVEDGLIVLDGDGWSESQPTGRWEFRCEDCDHTWMKRTPTTVTS